MGGASATGDADERGSIRRYADYIVVGLLILLVFSVAELLGELVSPEIGVWSFVAISAGLTLYSIQDFLGRLLVSAAWELRRQSKIPIGSEENQKYPWPLPFWLALVLLLGVILSSGELLRFWSLAFGGFRGYSPPSHDLFGWLLDVRDWFVYACSWVLDDVSANFWQVDGSHISSIEAVSPDAKGWVWIYNIVLEVLVLTIFWRAFRDFLATLLKYWWKTRWQ
jgi:hypothetical protein